jgi:hypothetical protein
VNQLETSGETVDATLPQLNSSPGRVQLRPVLVTVGLIAIFFAVVGLVLSLKPFSDAPPSGEPSLDIFAAGPVKEFAPKTVTYFEKEHLYLVRFADGAFLALYDLSPATQALVNEGDLTKLTCRAVLTQGDTVEGHLGSDMSDRGFGSTGLVDSCSGTIWDAEGMHVGGPTDGRLDRFPVAVINDIVRIHLGDRRCHADVADASPCIPTQ